MEKIGFPQLLGGRESAGHGVPIDDVPKCRDIVGPSVLVVQVIGMFPDVETEKGSSAFGKRAVLIRRTLHDQRSPIPNMNDRSTAALTQADRSAIRDVAGGMLDQLSYS